MPLLVIALAMTLVIEVPIVAAFYRGMRVRMAVAAIFANAATNFGMNYFLLGTHHYDATLLCGETLALVAEAVVYALVAGGDWPKAFTASAAANLASFSAGLLLFR